LEELFGLTHQVGLYLAFLYNCSCSLLFYSCACLEGFDGPRCQQTRLSFSGSSSSDGGSAAGWAWFPGLSSCDETHTSFELITTRDNGLIVYHGPLRDITVADISSGTGIIGDIEDFLVVELRAGYPVLRVNLGTGEARLTFDGRDKLGQIRVGKLSDGKWHRIDIFITGKVLCTLLLFHNFQCIYRMSFEFVKKN